MCGLESGARFGSFGGPKKKIKFFKRTFEKGADDLNMLDPASWFRSFFHAHQKVVWEEGEEPKF